MTVKLLFEFYSCFLVSSFANSYLILIFKSILRLFVSSVQVETELRAQLSYQLQLISSTDFCMNHFKLKSKQLHCGYLTVINVSLHV